MKGFGRIERAATTQVRAERRAPAMDGPRVTGTALSLALGAGTWAAWPHLQAEADARLGPLLGAWSPVAALVVLLVGGGLARAALACLLPPAPWGARGVRQPRA